MQGFVEAATHVARGARKQLKHFGKAWLLVGCARRTRWHAMTTIVSTMMVKSTEWILRKQASPCGQRMWIR